MIGCTFFTLRPLTINQTCIHVVPSYIAIATMEEAYVPSDWRRWGNFEVWWRLDL